MAKGKAVGKKVSKKASASKMGRKSKPAKGGIKSANTEMRKIRFNSFFYDTFISTFEIEIYIIIEYV